MVNYGDPGDPGDPIIDFSGSMIQDLGIHAQQTIHPAAHRLYSDIEIITPTGQTFMTFTNVINFGYRGSMITVKYSADGKIKTTLLNLPGGYSLVIGEPE